jgi:hypothetical protein
VHHSDNDATDWHLFSVRQNGVEPFVPLCLGGKHQPRAPVHLWLYYPWLVATQQAHERQPQEQASKIFTTFNALTAHSTFLSSHPCSSTATCCILYSVHASLSGNGRDIFWEEGRAYACPACERRIMDDTVIPRITMLQRGQPSKFPRGYRPC